MNKILIIGRLTKDPLLKYTENKKAVVRLNIAVQRPYKSKEGKYEADFIPCVFWDQKHSIRKTVDIIRFPRN